MLTLGLTQLTVIGIGANIGAGICAIHPRRRVPHRATWVIGVVSAVPAGVLPINAVAELTNIGVLLAFMVVSAAVLILRCTKPDLKRGFRCPGMPVVPFLGMVSPSG